MTGGPALPESVRARVLALAAERLGALPDAEVPPSLVAVRRFTPAKRARLGAAALAATLERDRVFLASVVRGVREALPDLAAALGAGDPPAASTPADAAAVAWLLQTPGWEALVSAVAAAEADARFQGARRTEGAELDRLRADLERVRSEAVATARRHSAQAEELRASLAETRRRQRPLELAAQQAEQQARAVRAAAEEEELASARGAQTLAEAEAARLRLRVAQLEGALDTARRTERGERTAADARVRVLVDTLLAAGQGLRRTLALGVEEAPAAGDAVQAALAAAAGAKDAPDATAGVGLGRAPEDPAVLDALLSLPTAHLIVDGYNVTKTGYGGLTLADQRTRLVAGLAALAARTGAEITVVFDGAGRPPLASPARDPRGVRVAWSPPGVTADEVVLRFVDAEPPGRPVVVVSSDGEVAGGARRRGARPVPSAALLTRLDRA